MHIILTMRTSDTKPTCIIIHGVARSEELWNSVKNERNWMRWVQDELHKKGIDTWAPHMPRPWSPTYAEWKREFEKMQEKRHEAILIGHSAGAAFLVRWLGEKIDEQNGRDATSSTAQCKIKKLILIAPGKVNGPGKLAEVTRDLYDFVINSRVKDCVLDPDGIVVFTSPEEPAHMQENVRLYKDVLGARVISLANHGHYTLSHMKKADFPELMGLLD